MKALRSNKEKLPSSDCRAKQFFLSSVYYKQPQDMLNYRPPPYLWAVLAFIAISGFLMGYGDASSPDGGSAAATIQEIHTVNSQHIDNMDINLSRSSINTIFNQFF